MNNKQYLKTVLFITFTVILCDDLLSQRTWCSNMCNWNFTKNYDLSTQKNDFEKLAELNETNDSIEILQRIIQFDCKNEIGQKAKQNWDEILRRQFTHLWELSLNNNLRRNTHASIGVPDDVKKKEKFLYLRQVGYTCEAGELYYSKK